GAQANGGGIYVGFASFPSVLTMTGCTVSGNAAMAGEGGGIFMYGSDSDASTDYELHNTMITNNIAVAAGGGLASLAGGYSSGPTLTLDQGSVISNNTSQGLLTADRIWQWTAAGGGISSEGPTTLNDVTITGNTAS